MTRVPGATKRLAERVILGSVMSVAAFVLERRLLKALKKRR